MWPLIELTRTLAGLYYKVDDIVALMIRADLNPGHYVLDSRAYTTWTLVLKRLEQQQKVKSIVAAALQDYPDNPVLKDVMTDALTIHKSVYAGDELTWKKPLTKPQYEKIIGEQSTLLPISFLETGMLKARAVGRVVTPDSLGSGFLIGNDSLFLTNNHVLDSSDIAGRSKVQFNYQKNQAGGLALFEEFEIEATGFQTSVTHDWTVVRLKGNPVEKYGFLPLKESRVREKDFVNIIQHPGGEHKQIALYHNVVTYVDDNIIQYLTDTLPGSSGSPVFNSAWDVVALHHSGGWLPEPATNNEAMRNEGVNISRILPVLKAQGLIA